MSQAGKLLIKGHDVDVNDMKFSTQDPHILCSADENTICIWQILDDANGLNYICMKKFPFGACMLRPNPVNAATFLCADSESRVGIISLAMADPISVGLEMDLKTFGFSDITDMCFDETNSVDKIFVAFSDGLDCEVAGVTLSKQSLFLHIEVPEGLFGMRVFPTTSPNEIYILTCHKTANGNAVRVGDNTGRLLQQVLLDIPTSTSLVLRAIQGCDDQLGMFIHTS